MGEPDDGVDVGAVVVGVVGFLPPLPAVDVVTAGLPTAVTAVRAGLGGRSFIRGAVRRSQNRPSPPPPAR